MYVSYDWNGREGALWGGAWDITYTDEEHFWTCFLGSVDQSRGKGSNRSIVLEVLDGWMGGLKLQTSEMVY